MEKHLNYEDNIFILNTRIRMVSDLLLLDADPELYLDKTIEDLDFIGETAKFILTGLMANRQLIEWDEQLHNLYDTEERFFDLLSRILNGKASFSIDNFPRIAEITGALAAACTERQKIIKEHMSEALTTTSDPRVVSVDELAALLTDMR
ncbi:MAG: hypothetical protein LBD22_01875 [Spirochaetaceae bacterium]|jgi:hypothetical protein|nr:hypothetical protein [Spirochaetaceae bacterium]